MLAEDHAEIAQVLARYARAIDERALDTLATVFAPDATIHYDVPGGAALGFAELAPWLRAALAPFRATQHALGLPLIEVDGDRARARTCVIATHVQVRLDGEERAVILHGVYRDQLSRTRAGWRITARRLEAVHTSGTFLAPEEARHFDAPPER